MSTFVSSWQKSAKTKDYGCKYQTGHGSGLLFGLRAMTNKIMDNILCSWSCFYHNYDESWIASFISQNSHTYPVLNGDLKYSNLHFKN